MSLILLISSITNRKSPELCHWYCWSPRWQTRSNLSFEIDITDLIDENPEVTWALSLILLIYLMKNRKSPELCHWCYWSTCWKTGSHLSFVIDITDLLDENRKSPELCHWCYWSTWWKTGSHLSFVIDIADLLDDKPEIVVPGQGLVHQVEVWKNSKNK